MISSLNGSGHRGRVGGCKYLPQSEQTRLKTKSRKKLIKLRRGGQNLSMPIYVSLVTLLGLCFPFSFTANYTFVEAGAFMHAYVEVRDGFNAPQVHVYLVYADE